MRVYEDGRGGKGQRQWHCSSNSRGLRCFEGDKWLLEETTAKRSATINTDEQGIYHTPTTISHLPEEMSKWEIFEARNWSCLQRSSALALKRIIKSEHWRSEGEKRGGDVGGTDLCRRQPNYSPKGITVLRKTQWHLTALACSCFDLIRIIGISPHGGVFTKSGKRQWS